MTGSGSRIARSQQALGVVGRGRDHHLEPRDVGEEGLHRLAVVQRAVDAGAVRRPDRDRAAVGAVAAVADPGRLLDDLVHGREDEVGELDLGDRQQAVGGRADGDAGDHRFGERRVDHAVVAELGPQAVGGEEDAALAADVLAQDDDPAVAAHLVAEALADRLDEGPDGHQAAPPPTPPARGGPSAPVPAGPFAPARSGALAPARSGRVCAAARVRGVCVELNTAPARCFGRLDCCVGRAQSGTRRRILALNRSTRCRRERSSSRVLS